MLPDEIIKLIIYILENIYNCSLICKKFNNLIDWNEYFEYRTDERILSILNKPIDVKSHKYFINNYDNVDQIVLYYPYIHYILTLIDKYENFYIDVIMKDDKIVRCTRQSNEIKWILTIVQSIWMTK